MGPDGDLWKGNADNTGSKYWHAGNDGAGSGLDADLLDGFNSSVATAGNTIVLRDANGDDNRRYGFGSYFNSTDDISTGTITYIMAKFGDNYYRSATAAKVATFISGQTMNISGNASTATTLQTARTINNVSFNGSANIVVPTIFDSNYRSIINPGGAQYVTSTSVLTGAIAITFPVGMTDSMVRITIKVYEYTTNESFEIHCGGYLYNVGNTWANNPFAYIVGYPDTDRRFNVRFGYTAAGRAIIYIGELASTWSYPQVFVTEVQVGYSGFSSTWSSGWAISFVSAAFENVTATISDCQVGFRASANTAKSLVYRDASGNFSAGTITATLSGNATSATTATSAGSVTNSVTFNNGGAGAASGTTFNGSAAQTISYNTIGASPLAGSTSLTTTGTVTTGTWSGSFGAVSGANLTSLTAGNLNGTIPSAVLGNSVHFIGTTSIALNRASASQTLTGVSIDGNSGTATILQTARTINSVSFNGSANITVTANTPNTLTLNTSGTGLSGSTTFNGGSATTFTVTSNATSANTVSTIVARDASGNFSAGTITAALSGNATTATNLSTTNANWSTNGTIQAVVGQLAWKNFGNSHTIFDASASTAPGGSAINNTTAQVAWSATYPTLMGWNGVNTYGVRVDVCRLADAATNVVGTAGRVLYNSALNTTTTSANLTFDGTNLVVGGTVTASSDIKLKENIEVINNALEKVGQIRGVTFTRNDLDDKEQRHAGVIAQEIEKVLPEVVIENNGIKSVAYGNLVGLLIEAIKEQQTQINNLNIELNKLKK